MAEMEPRHTQIEKALNTQTGTVVLEHPVGYPRGESNLYCLDQDGTTFNDSVSIPGTFFASS